MALRDGIAETNAAGPIWRGSINPFTASPGTSRCGDSKMNVTPANSNPSCLILLIGTLKLRLASWSSFFPTAASDFFPPGRLLNFD